MDKKYTFSDLAKIGGITAADLVLSMTEEERQYTASTIKDYTFSTRSLTLNQAMARTPDHEA